MSTMLRKFRWIISIALACSVGTLPSCASMGGGMRYAMPDPLSISAQDVSM
jgi:hypothetical protein